MEPWACVCSCRPLQFSKAPLLARLISSHLTPGFSPIHLHFGCAICFLNKTPKCLVLHTLCPVGASQPKCRTLFSLRWVMSLSVSGELCHVGDIVCLRGRTLYLFMYIFRLTVNLKWLLQTILVSHFLILKNINLGLDFINWKLIELWMDVMDGWDPF